MLFYFCTIIAVYLKSVFRPEIIAVYQKPASADLISWKCQKSKYLKANMEQPHRSVPKTGFRGLDFLEMPKVEIFKGKYQAAPSTQHPAPNLATEIGDKAYLLLLPESARTPHR